MQQDFEPSSTIDDASAPILSSDLESGWPAEPMTLPSFDVSAPGGSASTVRPQSRRDTVGDLAAALGCDRSQALLIDGRRCEPDVPLIRSSIASGSSVSHIREAAERSVSERRHVEPPRQAGSTGDVPDPDQDGMDDAVGERLVEIVVRSGPDCAPGRSLGCGRHVIGRSPTAHVRVEDPLMELHHVVLAIGAGDEASPNRSEPVVEMTQLTGRIPVLIDGRPLGADPSIELPAVIAIGGSSFALRSVESCLRTEVVRSVAAGQLMASSSDPWRRVVHRGPATAAPPSVPSIVAPVEAAETAAPPATGLIGAAIAVIGAAAVALILGQMMFAVFALVGAAASVGTWLVGAIGTWRANRRSRRVAAISSGQFSAGLTAAAEMALRRHCAIHDDIAHVLGSVDALGSGATSTTIWRRRLTTPSGDRVDQLRAVLGRGTRRWQPTVVGSDGAASVGLSESAVREVDHTATMFDVAIPVTFAPGSTTALRGDSSTIDAVTRSLVIQLSTTYGPADWQLVVVTGRPDRWGWARWLPHAFDGAGLSSVIDAADAVALSVAIDAARTADRDVLLVVDTSSLFSTHTGPVRRFLETASPATLVLVELDGNVPAVCERTVTVGSTGRITVAQADVGGVDAVVDEWSIGAVGDITMCGVSPDRADRAARALAGLIDPESDRSSGGRSETSVALVDVDPIAAGLTASDAARRVASRTVARRWSECGPDPAPIVTLGRSADGVVDIDLVVDGPHALIAGTTWSGKSDLLRSMISGLALPCSPDHLTVVLVDYNGGSTFDACAALPKTVGVVTDLDDGLAARALVSLDAELHRRERMLRSVGAADLTEYRRHADAETLPRLVVVIDEFAALAEELPDFLSALVGVAQCGRSLGLHMVLATQRPAGVVNDDIRTNMNMRVALRLDESADAHDVVGDDVSTTFSRALPGRAVLRLGPDELVVFQLVTCTGPAVASANRLQVQDGVAFRNSNNSGFLDRPGDVPSELEAAVAVVNKAAALCGSEPPHRPWVDALPKRLCCGRSRRGGAQRPA